MLGVIASAERLRRAWLAATATDEPSHEVQLDLLEARVHHFTAVCDAIAALAPENRQNEVEALKHAMLLLLPADLGSAIRSGEGETLCAADVAAGVVAELTKWANAEGLA